MNPINYIQNKISVGIQEIQDIYQHRPAAYDIAIGVLRPSIMAYVSLSMFKSASIAHITDASFILGCFLLNQAQRTAIKDISSLINWSKLNKFIKHQNKNNVILICIPKHGDSGGATARLSNPRLKLYKELAKTHSLVIKKISSVPEINKEIEEINQQGKKVQVLWLLAHGCPDDICLGSNHFLGLIEEVIVGNDVRQNKQGLKSNKESPVNTIHFKSLDLRDKESSVDTIHFESLDLRADIILESCSTGGVSKTAGGDRLNIAEWFQLYAGQEKRVFAPRTTTYGDLPPERIIASDGTVSYQFKSQNNEDNTADISYTQVLEKWNKLNKAN